MRIWHLPSPAGHVPDALLDVTGGSVIVADLLMKRGILSPDKARAFLDPRYYGPSPPSALPQLARAADRLEQAIRTGERICVWGDFDVDGQTSTTLLVTALEQLGAEVIYHIPIREAESHGIRPPVLQQYLAQGIGLLLTCDTGIAAVDAVALAQQAGVDVVVTDHHDLPDTLPDAHALVNPKFLGHDHPLSSLPGVGVAYKLVEELFGRAGREADLEGFLDLVALGIVADIAIQERDARFLLQRGLGVLRTTQRAGLRAVMDRAHIVPAYLTEEDIGFGIGPRLNAVGRLSDANVSVPLLSTGNPEEAARIADRLERLNDDRRLLTDQVYEGARNLIDRRPSLLQYAVLVLNHATWHQGVIGIVASRLVEEFGKPAILFSSPEGQPARGSARSVDGYHITRAIATQSALLHGFGGHPMAAGLSLDAANIETFRRGVSRAIIEQRGDDDLTPSLRVDALVTLNQLMLDMADELERLAPFGPGNPPINLLCRNVRVMHSAVIGQTGKHRKMGLGDDEGNECEVLWWNGANDPVPSGRMDVVLRLRPGFFNGKRTATITLQDHRVAGPVVLPARDADAPIIEDMRAAPSPREAIKTIRAQETDLQIWGEVLADLPGLKTRLDLHPAASLVVWTTPPRHEVIQAVLARVRPRRIYVFAQDPAIDSIVAFQKRLAGLALYTLHNYQGETTVEKLAAAMGHTAATVLEGLTLLADLGFSAHVTKEQRVRLAPCEQRGAARATEGRLKEMLAETRSFRSLLRSSTSLSAFFAIATTAA